MADQITATLGVVLQDLGRLSSGQGKTWSDALRIGEAALRPDHPNVATYSSNLGMLLRHLGRPSRGQGKARTCSEDRAEAVFGPDHPSVAIRLNNLGLVLRDLGEIDAARAHMSRALEIYRKSSR